jgi:hypothetical protein
MLVVNISQADAMELGATDFVLTSDDNFVSHWESKVDLIIVCRLVSPVIPSDVHSEYHGRLLRDSPKRVDEDSESSRSLHIGLYPG